MVHCKARTFAAGSTRNAGPPTKVHDCFLVEDLLQSGRGKPPSEGIREVIGPSEPTVVTKSFMLPS